MASWVPGESEGELALRTSWCPGGLREFSLHPRDSGWLVSLARYSLAEWENAPSSAGLLGILVGLTLKATILGIVFVFVFFSSLVLRAPVGKLLSQYNPSLSVDLCNIYCSGLEPMEIHTGKKSPFLRFFSDISEGSLRRP